MVRGILWVIANIFREVHYNIDSMKLDIRIIALGEANELLSEMKTIFPEANVDIQRGIDLRKSATEDLFETNLISHSAYHSITNGRRWHHELASNAAVGLAQANRLAVDETSETPLLLLEEDCLVKYASKLKLEVAYLLSHSEKFDMAIFGAIFKGKSKNKHTATWLPDGFYIIKDKFFCTHCVLYTPSGRRKVSKLLRKPLEMQIDSLYGSEAKRNGLIVLGQLEMESCVQRHHASTVQMNDVIHDVLPIHTRDNRHVYVALVVCLVLCICTGSGTYLLIRTGRV